MVSGVCRAVEGQQIDAPVPSKIKACHLAERLLWALTTNVHPPPRKLDVGFA